MEWTISGLWTMDSGPPPPRRASFRRLVPNIANDMAVLPRRRRVGGRVKHEQREREREIGLSETGLGWLFGAEGERMDTVTREGKGPGRG